MVHGVFTGSALPAAERAPVVHRRLEMNEREALALHHLIVQRKIDEMKATKTKQETHRMKRKKVSWAERLAQLDRHTAELHNKRAKLEDAKKDAFRRFRELLAKEEADKREREKQRAEEDKQRAMHETAPPPPPPPAGTATAFGPGAPSSHGGPSQPPHAYGGHPDGSGPPRSERPSMMGDLRGRAPGPAGAHEGAYKRGRSPAGGPTEGRYGGGQSPGEERGGWGMPPGAPPFHEWSGGPGPAGSPGGGEGRFRGGGPGRQGGHYSGPPKHGRGSYRGRGGGGGRFGHGGYGAPQRHY
eukprot:m.96677 g.96677  ORF g.96677 m.96677 type:complete len:299 (+) comp8799_c0_seq4:977-1873(+)